MGREHWVETTLGACCQINPRNKVNDESLEVTFVTMSDISQNSPLFKSTQVRSFSEVKKGFTHFAENDVLFAKITPCMENGKAALANNLQNGLGCGTTELHVIRPLCGVESAFVYNFVHQPIFRTEAEQRFTGSAGQRRVPVDFLYEYPFPLPPLNEQKRIVEKLDAILPKVKNAKARLEKIPLILKKFRQSVLSAACSGRLTEDWREGKDLAEWEELRIQDVGVIGRGKSKHRPRNDQKLFEGPYPFIQTGDVAQSDGFIRSHSQTYNELGLAQSKLWPANTLCITIAANIANTGILNYPACFPDSIVGFIPNPLKSELKYIKWVVDTIKNDLENYAPATAQKNINLGILNDIVFKCPSLEEQQEIVRRVEKLFTLADSLETKYKKAIQQVEKIEQSILAKAFKGELTDPDPTDEPSAELLKRILEEKSKLESTKKPKSKRSGKKTIFVV